MERKRRERGNKKGIKVRKLSPKIFEKTDGA